MTAAQLGTLARLRTAGFRVLPTCATCAHSACADDGALNCTHLGPWVHPSGWCSAHTLDEGIAADMGDLFALLVSHPSEAATAVPTPQPDRRHGLPYRADEWRDPAMLARLPAHVGRDLCLDIADALDAIEQRRRAP